MDKEDSIKERLLLLEKRVMELEDHLHIVDSIAFKRWYAEDCEKMRRANTYQIMSEWKANEVDYVRYEDEMRARMKTPKIDKPVVYFEDWKKTQ
jgi:hypothetical protein